METDCHNENARFESFAEGIYQKFDGTEDFERFFEQNVVNLKEQYFNQKDGETRLDSP